MKRDRVHLDEKELVPFCRQHHITKLAFFGSVLRDDFRPDSDVDVLVEFEAKHVPGLIGLAGHRSVGGLRVSLYNPMPMAGVKVLSEFMAAFQAKHG